MKSKFGYYPEDDDNVNADVDYFKPVPEEAPYGNAFKPKSRHRRDGANMLKPQGDDRRAD